MNIQNLSIQVIPINTEKAYYFIDKAIEVIKNSGLTYNVTPFSTVVEGNFKALQNLIENIQTAIFTEDLEEVILNIQFHAKKNKDVFLIEKTDKFS